VHDIEEAWARGLLVSMLTLDIKGAFDAVLRGRLIQRLCSQGCPPTVLHWADIFCTYSLLAGSFSQELCFGIGSGVYSITIFEWRGWEGAFCPVPFDCFEDVLAVREIIQLCTPVVLLCLVYYAAETSLLSRARNSRY